MPLTHIRICNHCGHKRFAACSTGCRIPKPDYEPSNWTPNVDHPDADGVATQPHRR